MVVKRCCHSDKKKNPSPLNPSPDESGPGYPFSETPFKEKFHPRERYFSELGKDKTGPKVVQTMEHYVANVWDAKDWFIFYGSQTMSHDMRYKKLFGVNISVGRKQ